VQFGVGHDFRIESETTKRRKRQANAPGAAKIEVRDARKLYARSRVTRQWAEELSLQKIAIVRDYR